MQARVRRPVVASVAAAVVALTALACSPTLDWRETRPAASGAALLFPCRPEGHERAVQIGAATLRWHLHACGAGGASYSLASADVADPVQVTSLLAALKAQAIANVSGTASAAAPPAIAGATPNPESARLRIVGTRPDGRPVVAHAAFFVKGLRLYQAMVLGADAPPDRDGAEAFLASIRLP